MVDLKLLITCVNVSLSGVLALAHIPLLSLCFSFCFAWFVSESTSVGQHREAGKVISETGGWLPDSGGNR